MPQMNKGGKLIFGKSIIREDGRIQIPTQTMQEYRLPKNFGECQEEFGQLGEAGRVTGAGSPAGDEGNEVSLRDVP